MNIMGTTARPNQIDEDDISSTVGNGNNGTRVNAGLLETTQLLFIQHGVEEVQDQSQLMKQQ